MVTRWMHKHDAHNGGLPSVREENGKSYVWRLQGGRKGTPISSPVSCDAGSTPAHSCGNDQTELVNVEETAKR